MRIDSSLVLCAAAIGVAQVLDCGLLRAGRKRGRTALAFSVVEWLWGVLCVYLLIKQPDYFPPWLAAVFVAQLAAWTLYVIVQMRRGRAAETFELTPSEALAGGVFGAAYATASVAAWWSSGG